MQVTEADQSTPDLRPPSHSQMFGVGIFTRLLSPLTAQPRRQKEQLDQLVPQRGKEPT